MITVILWLWYVVYSNVTWLWEAWFLLMHYSGALYGINILWERLFLAAGRPSESRTWASLIVTRCGTSCNSGCLDTPRAAELRRQRGGMGTTSSSWVCVEGDAVAPETLGATQLPLESCQPLPPRMSPTRRWRGHSHISVYHGYPQEYSLFGVPRAHSPVLSQNILFLR